MMLSPSLRGDDGVGLALLRYVGNAVIEEWTERPGRQFLGQETVVTIVEDVIGAVEKCRTDDEPRFFVGEIPDRYLYHRLIAQIRERLLESWWEVQPSFSDSDASEVLRIACCLERIRLELWPDEDKDLATRLAGPDTFELLVEVAHDMRSPLSSILFLSETLRGSGSGEVNDLQRKQLGLIYGAALGLLSITNDVVDAARSGRGYLDEEPAPFSLGDVFDSIEELVHPVAEEKGLTLEFRGPEHDFMLGHQMALTRVLLNLVTNSLKFTEEGGVTVTAERIGRTTLEIAVEDTGRGMDEHEVEKVLRPFQKSEYRSGYFFSSSGLGLSIAQHLLSSMGSTLEVESSVGVGTRSCFRIDLPRVSSH